MNIREILQQLQRVPAKADFAPYETALRAAIEQRETITPELIAAIDRAAARPAPFLADHEDCRCLFAIYLLAQFREPRALDSFLRFFSLPGEASLDLTGDMVTDHGAAVFASVCGGDPAPLLKLIHDEAVNEYVRSEAIDALVVQYHWGERPREAVIEELRRLFRTLPKPGNAYLWASLASAICDFPAPELAAEARQAFAEGLVDEQVLDLPLVEESLAKPDDAARRAFRECNAPIDAVAQCSGWLCFRDEEEGQAALSEAEDENQSDATDTAPSPAPTAWRPKPYNTPLKVGRNDLCPCGSGKKFKKCCGKK